MDLKNQRRIASEVLKCGINRVWIDPDRIEDVADAVTRNDIKLLIKSKAIQKKQKQGISRARSQHIKRQKSLGKRKGHGSRKGTKYSRAPRKRQWIRTIRPVRRKLRELRDTGKIDRTTYRKFYGQASGGVFKNRQHLESHLEASGLIIKEVE